MPAAKSTAFAAATVLLIGAVVFAGAAAGVRPVDRDTTPPSAPSDVRVTSATTSEVVLDWTPSQDNVAVAGYHIFGDRGREDVQIASYTVTSLSCGRSGRITLEAHDTSGNKSERVETIVSAAPCRDSTPPTVPSGFRQDVTTEDAVVVSWTPSTDVSGVVGYGLYQTVTQVASTPEPKATLSGLRCGSTHQYGVDAVDGAGNRSLIATMYVQTSACSDREPPSAPTGLTVTSRAATSVGLSWAASSDNSGVVAYEVLVSGSAVANVSATTAMVTGLACSTSYSLGVRALDAAGNRSTASVVTASTATCSTPPSGDTTAPSVPTNVAVTSSTRTSIALSWNASTDNVAVSGYGAYLNGQLVGSATQTSYTLSSLACGTAYAVAIDAYDQAGNRSSKASVTASTAACSDTQAPSAPANLTATSRTTTSIALSWSASTDNVGVAGYGLYRAGTLVGNTTQTTAVFSGLTCNTSYTLTVDAYDASGNRSTRSNTLVSTTACPDTTQPSAPSVLAVSSASQTSLTLGWTASTDNVGVAGYDVYRSGSKIGTTQDTSYAFGNLTCGTSYTLGVAAFDSAGNRSSQVTTSEATSACSGPSPSGFPASFTNGPLGTRNILPARSTGALLGVWPQGTPGTPRQNDFTAREAALGRKLDIYGTHYASPIGGCDYGTGYSPFTAGEEQWAVDTGHHLVINWNHGWTMSQVNAGAADACLLAFGQRASNFGRPLLLRIYWEFDGTWFNWHACGQAFVDAWRRTVTKIREGGGTNVGYVWSPSGKYDRICANASYPGDAWVDWVSMSLYNRDDPNAWYSVTHGGWADFTDILSYPTASPPAIYDTYSPRKPFMTAETGSEEDPDQPGRKAQWFLDTKDDATQMAGLRALVYFDLDVRQTEGFNWRLDTSASALSAFRELAADPFFNVRSP